ncbi:MAG TPA: methyltransferase domain-containing protein [Terracidiphilus sp.]|nr:methyltransferase domain-containing protein [Terracidiphilus sp.]
MNTFPIRRPYQGVLQILQFNRRSYMATSAGVAAALLAAPFLPPLWRTGLLLAVVPALFWLTSSLLVSHYVYDRFPLYDLNWLSRVLPRRPQRWINIHCGLDETSSILAAIFPDAVGHVVDIFEPHVMTETSIRQARCAKHDGARPLAARYDDLVFAANSFDTAFAIFSAHELRRHDQRVGFFREIARVLVHHGELVLIEHSRDWRNLLAFGPGFLHFFSPLEWRGASASAGLELRAEFFLTPFVHVYLLRRTT